MKFALIVPSLFAAYIATYFLVLALPTSRFLMINGEVIPDYHGIPTVVFAPIHNLDTQYFRPTYWQPYPRNHELGFEWLTNQIH
jgi:hypothetical protein